MIVTCSEFGLLPAYLSGPEFRVMNTSSQLEVEEGVRSVKVCIGISRPAIECPVTVPMYMRVSTQHGDTGK